jgi:hypothetical protein
MIQKNWNNKLIKVEYKTIVPTKKTTSVLIEFTNGSLRYFPKSQVKITKKYLQLPYWLWNKKQDEKVYSFKNEKIR